MFYEVDYFPYTDDFQTYICRLICPVFFKPLLVNIFSFMAYRDFKVNMTKVYPSTQTSSSHCVPPSKGWYHHPSIRAQTGNLGVIYQCLLSVLCGHLPLHPQSCDLRPLSLEGIVERAVAMKPHRWSLNPSYVTLGKRESYICLK